MVLGSGLCRKSLAVTAGKERIRHFIKGCGGEVAPDIYLLALQKLDLPGDSCVSIEEPRDGLLGAPTAGITTIVTPSIDTRDENFEEAELALNSLESLDFSAISSLFG